MTKEYKEGWKACADSKELNECPYKQQTVEAKRWCAGWYEANRDPVLLSEKSALL